MYIYVYIYIHTLYISYQLTSPACLGDGFKLIGLYHYSQDPRSACCEEKQFFITKGHLRRSAKKQDFGRYIDLSPMN